MIEAIKACPDLTWSCTNAALEATNGLDVGTMSPIGFSPESHFSHQEITLMKANPETFNFEPIE